MGHFVSKLAGPHNSGCALRIFLKFCTMKGAKRHMNFMFVVFTKKILLRVNELLWAQKCCDLRTLLLKSALRDLFIILHNERGEEVQENDYSETFSVDLMILFI